MNRTRREFLATAAAGTLAMGSHVHAQGQDRTLKLGVIGVGWYGMVDAKAALKVGGVEVTAVCDIDGEHLTQAADDLEKQQGPGKRPREFKLYDQMLDQAELDVLVIASPPQWHALQLIAAVNKGLDVYCEKPISYDIREGRAMVEAVKRSGRIVQVGFQRRQGEAFRQVKEFLAAGKAGKIVQVDCQIHHKAGTQDPTPQDPPASLDWDLWCGPGPKIPYSPQVGHRHWRLEKTSGHGHLVDWGIHNVDATRMILGLGAPRRITADGGTYYFKDIITTPDALTVHFEFDELPVVWRHRLWGAAEYAPEVKNGIFFFGDEATVFASDRRWIVIPRGKSDQRQEFEISTDMNTNHMADFLAAVRSRQQPACPIADGYTTTKTVQLAMIAYETNSVVHWDEASEQIRDNAPATALLQGEYRQPWKHPYQGS